ncbi:unnamed protein product [Rangifer tarandus platyrhynchus]|uniref:Uncharacterized protein n=1 Tax=Rangifer tarandus platyrhynchus TaxID=3082113 RepID=A0AC59YHN6_RANTA
MHNKAAFLPDFRSARLSLTLRRGTTNKALIRGSDMRREVSRNSDAFTRGSEHSGKKKEGKKTSLPPPPPPVSDARAQPGLEPTFPRGGGRRAQAGTRICHLKSTNHEIARPSRLR